MLLRLLSAIFMSVCHSWSHMTAMCCRLKVAGANSRQNKNKECARDLETLLMRKRERKRERRKEADKESKTLKRTARWTEWEMDRERGRGNPLRSRVRHPPPFPFRVSQTRICGAAAVSPAPQKTTACC